MTAAGPVREWWARFAGHRGHRVKANIVPAGSSSRGVPVKRCTPTVNSTSGGASKARSSNPPPA